LVNNKIATSVITLISFQQQGYEIKKKKDIMILKSIQLDLAIFVGYYRKLD